jgi:hypothetical protein
MKHFNLKHKANRFRRLLFAVALLPLFGFSPCDVLTGILNDYGQGPGLTEAEVSRGLKAALKEGARFAGQQASQNNGYLNNPIVDIRILLPPELRKAERSIRRVPVIGDRLVDDLVNAMNKGAERAASEAAPIFVDAITNMTIRDAMNILKGDSTAATQYLQKTTSGQLEATFQPVLQESLDDVGATRYYNTLRNAIDKYNRTPLVNKLDVNLNELPELEVYATDRALDGLFRLVAVEEKKIRKNPFSYGEQIIRKVFGSLKSGQS